jgi:APA family basic amino acid/polyamine antiporter
MSKNNRQLTPTLGLLDILMFGVGGIVGAGIYAIIGEAAGLAGNMLWLSFAIAAFIALLTGLTYAEFVSRYPDAGGSFEYVKQGFNQRTALILSVIMLLTGIIAPAAIAISFSDYLSRLLDLPNWVSTIAIILLMAGVNIVGIQQSSWFNTIATVITLLGLGAVVVFAVPEWGSTPLTEMPEQGWTGLLSGAALIFFSYVGFEDLVKTAEETKNAETVMPKGIIISGLIVLAIYLLIAISAVSVLNWEKLADSNGPLAQVMESVAGKAWVTGLIVVALFATSKTILSNILGTSRLLYDVARDSDLKWLKKIADVNAATNTPVRAILAIAAMTVLFALIGNLKTVASISNIFVLLLFLIVNIALIRLRLLKGTEQEAPFRVPLNLGKVPLPTIVAIIGLAILLGFNVYNIL